MPMLPLTAENSFLVYPVCTAAAHPGGEAPHRSSGVPLLNDEFCHIGHIRAIPEKVALLLA